MEDFLAEEKFALRSIMLKIFIVTVLVNDYLLLNFIFVLSVSCGLSKNVFLASKYKQQHHDIKSLYFLKTINNVSLWVWLKALNMNIISFQGTISQSAV